MSAQKKNVTINIKILTARGELGSMNESGLPGIPIGDPIPPLFRRCALEVIKIIIQLE